MASDRPASVPLATLRTEQLCLFAFPRTQEVHELSSKRGIQQLLKIVAAEPKAESPSEDLFFYCIGLKEQLWIGDVMVSVHPGSHICNLGYSVFPAFRRRGYATEAVRAVVEWIISTDAEAIVAETFSDWPYSIRVMEKAGLKRVETDIGPYFVRYAYAKGDSNVDLTEQRVITLTPFGRSRLQSILVYFQWLWSGGEELIVLATILIFTYSFRAQIWIAVLGACAFVLFAAFMIRRFAAWWPTARTETHLQFREQGLFWASRDGTGGMTSWKILTHWRMARRKGIELWNGETWYWIQPQALSGLSLDLVQAFLTEHGVESGKPPEPIF